MEALVSPPNIKTYLLQRGTGSIQHFALFANSLLNAPDKVRSLGHIPSQAVQQWKLLRVKFLQQVCHVDSTLNRREHLKQISRS